ncbi:malonate decarboxylase holo-ACP synthase [Inquilinus ginsengisoli]|uniref:malonate decarboxylase holo-ACP synthase n=1 Tax=Inquilinus ginsengisoli TaxID=363840 RepID=UPI00286B414D|nr:malonate decarboxylase holo-ACP synthase [Inquilinus ginsengisoli]
MAPLGRPDGLLRYARNDDEGRGGGDASVLPHDLLRIDPGRLGELPNWAVASLDAVPWVVVRRAPPRDGQLPVGIRGAGRGERCAAWLPADAVVAVRTPEDLATAAAWRGHARRGDVPALAILDPVAELLGGRAWGPAGSVGFELATGHPAAHRDSDLDIVLRAPHRIGRDLSDRLVSALARLPVRVDVVLETPLGGCSLAEVAAGGRPLVVKTLHGPRLVDDPWPASP